MGDWRSVLTVDYLGTVRLLDGLLPHAGPGTAAICFASLAAHQGHLVSAETFSALDDPRSGDLFDRLAAAADGEITSGAAYIWSKIAIVRLCERAAVAWGARGARIVSLSPGLIDTPMGRLELDNPRKKPLLGLTPLVRERRDGQSELPGRCEDIAQAVAFLASDAASFITGCDIRIDGGLTGALRYQQH
jgi:NAD(P)-dependent dehydrogenase (short-subunit alcohol dehydrogenase family)